MSAKAAAKKPMTLEDKAAKYPVWLTVLMDIGVLLGVAAAGFIVFYAVDILLLDWDPILRLIYLFTGTVVE